MHSLRAKHGSIAYTIAGEGPPLIMLRGLGRTIEHWLGYQKSLETDFRVVTMDLRGIGRSQAPCRWTTSIFDLADDVVALLDHLEIPAAHVLGVSLGGMITLALGIKAPERCLSLIPINTSVGGLGSLRLHPKVLAGMGPALLEMRAAAPQRCLVDLLVGPACPADLRQEVANTYAEITSKDGTIYFDTVAKQLVAAARFRVLRNLKKLRVPTLLVYGTEDRFVPNINSRKLAGYLPEGTLMPIIGGGHELSIDKGPELKAVVIRWVKDLDQRRAHAPTPAINTTASNAKSAIASGGIPAEHTAAPARKVLKFARSRNPRSKAT